MRIHEGNITTDTKASEGGEENASGSGVRIALQLMMKTMERQAVPLQSVEDYGGADTYPAACAGPRVTSGGCALKGSCSQGRPHARTASLQNL